MKDEKTQAEGLDKERLLTAKEIILGGDEPNKRLEVQSIRKHGKPGVLYLKPLPARDVIAFASVEKKDQMEAMCPLIAKAIVHEDGSPMFTAEESKQLLNLRVDAFTELSEAITAMMGPVTPGEESEAGEVSGEATGSASPTDSHSN